MSYTPFIVASYLIATTVLTWAAVAPVIRKRALLRQLKARQARKDRMK